jgi:hypothetical protein
MRERVRVEGFSCSLEVSVEAGEARQLEDWVVGLFLELAAPVPGRGQAAVDARACG